MGRDAIQFTPLSDVMAAEVTGLDLSAPLTDATRAAIQSAFLAHQMLVFRNQELSKDTQVAFTEQFGTLERHAITNITPGAHPLVHIVSNLGPDGQPSGIVKSTRWHSDKSFRPAPSMATILHAVTLPPDGGTLALPTCTGLMRPYRSERKLHLKASKSSIAGNTAAITSAERFRRSRLTMPRQWRTHSRASTPKPAAQRYSLACTQHSWPTRTVMKDPRRLRPWRPIQPRNNSSTAIIGAKAIC
jgi:alpha-ketoglutarate-dependent taurine dioxygenase